MTASCDVWMMVKSVVSVTVIVGYNPCHTPRHRTKETLDVSLEYSSPCGFHILPKLSGVAAGGVSQTSRCASMDHMFSIGDRSGE
ncbi:hypothetical protein TNCV_2063731 [Trichonephila clavipes]|nr:hypothetical protein TNCV_2063731 [Trichonephila clavipes]